MKISSLHSASLRLFGLIFLLAALCSLLTAQSDYTHWVNPFIGTGAHGHTFPGATTPFGMVQLSPDTRGADWDGSSGYHFSDDVIYGFSHTHLSGTGIPDYCDILLMPTVDAEKDFSKSNAPPRDWNNFQGFMSQFSHRDESAEPGYYSVKLDGGKLLAEMTSTPRVGIQRYTFPESTNGGIFLDLLWRDKLLGSDIKFVSPTRLEGFRRSSSWAKDQVIYFVIELSKSSGCGWGVGNAMASTGPASSTVTNARDELKARTFCSFKTRPGEQILVKVALSPVSIEGARKNLAAEMPGWDFDKVRADAKAAWNKELSKIEVSGGTDAQMTTFYTALYHTMIQPNIFEDVDGSYLGHDGKIHNIRDDAPPGRGAEEKGSKGAAAATNPQSAIRNPQLHHEYTVFSLWDTFRAAHPLYTIIDQKRTVDFINTFIRQYEQGGRLPVWELAGNETDCMIGYHAVSVIADAMAKGIKGFDYEKAYEAAKHSAELDREGLAAYKRRGYISMEDSNESVSKTLEYAYDDWCIAQMVEILGRRGNSNFPLIVKNGQVEQDPSPYRTDWSNYMLRAASYRNLFDTQTGFMRPKKNGGFVSPFAPNEVGFVFTEGNSWQYTFFVPQDILGLAELMGGRERFADKLDELFTTTQKLGGREQADLTGLIGQYAHGNEPSHHIAYLYNYTSRSSETQKYVRKIMDEFYKPTPDGLIGNEDCGQMSAWYVMSALGFYQVTPGRPYYDLGTPLFKRAKINLENGKSFVIDAPNVSEKNIYVRSATVNGKGFAFGLQFTHEEIMAGGILRFDMSSTPMDFVRPSGLIDWKRTNLVSTVAVPAIDGDRTFVGSTTVTITTPTPRAKILYTVDGQDPAGPHGIQYSAPFSISKTSTIRTIAVDGGGSSYETQATLSLRPHDWTVKVLSGYSRQYTGGGENAIVDGIRGTTNFASGEWQGVQGKPYEAVIDLQRPTNIREVGASFLQDAGPWIWMPDRIEFEVSADGTNFTKVAEIKPNFPQQEMTPTIKEYNQTITPTSARYVRIRAFNFGRIPSWHPGAGGDPWIFIDEAWVR